jgi:hypothetical protein
MPRSDSYSKSSDSGVGFSLLRGLKSPPPGPWPKPRLQAKACSTFLGLAFLHGTVLLAWPAAPVIALGVWWNSNTIAHNFIHRPFFHSARLNRMFSLYLSVLLGIPQTLWRERHLAHHRRLHWRLRGSPQLMTESALIIGLWASIALVYPHFFLTAYVPGYFAGLGLCVLQGYYEHAHGVTSHYGALYNFLCFNDGYHSEHHAHPRAHWSELPRYVKPGARTSRWPAPVRWLDHALECLERIVLRSPGLQRFVLSKHRAALTRLVPQDARRVLIVGGGLFPRTPLILRELLPQAQIEIIDENAANLDTARRILGNGFEYIHQHYQPRHSGHDLVVIPLAYAGSREIVYRDPPARAVLVHDWIWKRRGIGRVISFALLKRVNLVATC